MSDVADFIAKFDTNGDGVLDVEERQHIVEYLNAWAERLKVMGTLRVLCSLLLVSLHV